MDENETPYWRATVVYRTDTGPVEVVHKVEDIVDLADRVELGFHFDAVTHITFSRVGWIEDPNMTVEQSVRL